MSGVRVVTGWSDGQFPRQIWDQTRLDGGSRDDVEGSGVWDGGCREDSGPPRR